MPEVVDQFLTLPILVFMMFIWALTWAQRKGLETKFATLKDSKAWREFWVPFLPLLNGGLIAAPLKMYPFPEAFSTYSGRVMVGVVCGLGCGFLYRIAKKMVLEKLGKKSDESTPPESTPPESDSPAV